MAILLNAILTVAIVLITETNCYYPANFIPRAGSPCPNGAYAPDPYVCNQYLQCNQGVFISRPCGPGTVWNAAKTTCDYPRNTVCQTPLAVRRPGIVLQQPYRQQFVPGYQQRY